MTAFGDDCFFFLSSSCSKGSACPFRHVEAAKSNNVVCQHWLMGGCYRHMCRFRHSEYAGTTVPASKTDVFCIFETQPAGCTRPDCSFKHLKPRPSIAGTVTSTSAVPVPVESVSASKFTTPQVTPVVIQPAESEESNSSPIKRSAVPALQEGKKNELLKFDLDDTVMNTDKKENSISNNSITKEIKTKKKIRKTSTLTSEKPVLKKKVKKINPQGKTTIALRKSPTTPSLGKTKIGAKKIIKKKIVKKTPAKKVRAVDEEDVRPNMKSRLGGGGVSHRRLADVAESVEEKTTTTASDSDDSIENIKVMSMEEIFRQKALDSMLKKRAATGKDPLPTTKPKPVSRLASTKQDAKPAMVSSSINRKAVGVVKKPLKKVSPASRVGATVRKVTSVVEEAEESSEEEDSSSSSSSSEDDGTSSDSSDDSSADQDNGNFEPDVRRVVVDEDTEELARKRAKASLLARKKMISKPATIIHRTKSGGVSKPEKRLKDERKFAAVSSILDLDYNKSKKPKKRIINMDFDTDSDRLFATREKKVNVYDRLGESKRNVIDTSQNTPKPALMSLKLSPKKSKIENSGSSGEEQEELAGVKVKTLEEIRQEKMNTRVVELETDNQNNNAELSDIPVKEKKSRKRPWRKVQTNTENAVQTGNETNQEESQSTFTEQRNILTSESCIEESPFEQLKRKALMKKMQKTGQLGPAPSVNLDEELEILDNNQRKSSKKSHKHKHKHKKSKEEREIYMPPGLKKSVALVKPTQSCSLTTVEQPSQQDVSDISGREGQRMKSHKMAAAWMAGLSTSSKGIFKRPEVAVSSERKFTPEPVSQRLGIGNTPSQRLGTGNTANTVSQPPVSMVTNSSSSSELPIKSFSEIMAEKRKRRLEMMAQKNHTGAAQVQSLSSSSVTTNSKSTFSSNIPSSTNAEKVRVPISPILFDKKGAAPSFKSHGVKPLPPSSKPSAATGSFSFAAPSVHTSVHSVTPNRNKTLSNNFSKDSLDSKRDDDDILDLDDSSLSLDVMDIPATSTSRVSGLSQSGSDASHHTALPDVTTPVSPVKSRVNPPALTPVSTTPLTDTHTHPAAVKHKSPSSESLIPKKKSRVSLDDDPFADLLDDGDMETYGTTGGHVDEDMDDLLANIDDLLEGD